MNGLHRIPQCHSFTKRSISHFVQKRQCSAMTMVSSSTNQWSQNNNNNNNNNTSSFLINTSKKSNNFYLKGGWTKSGAHHSFQPQMILKYHYSTTPPKFQNTQEDEHSPATATTTATATTQPTILYEAPFASLAKRLKRISVASAIASLVGIPLLITFHAGDVPASGQLAVGSTAILAACGSTAALTFCFGPYVHTLETTSNNKDNNSDNNNEEEEKIDDEEQSKVLLIKATTNNIFGMEKITIFDPEIDTGPPASNNYRPFCNFTIRDQPFYIHPEMLSDDKLRVQLVGKALGTLVKEVDENSDGDHEKKKKKNKDLDDEFL